MHSAGGLVWSAGLISFCIRTKRRSPRIAATMPLASGLQVLLSTDMGTAGVAGAGLIDFASMGRPKRRPRSSEARARVKRRAAQW